MVLLDGAFTATNLLPSYGRRHSATALFVYIFAFESRHRRRRIGSVHH
jgi:hypothetical protein